MKEKLAPAGGEVISVRYLAGATGYAGVTVMLLTADVCKKVTDAVCCQQKITAELIVVKLDG